MAETLTREFHNDIWKREFLNSFSEGTQNTYARIFEQSKNLEDKWGKDIANWNLAQIKEFLIMLQPTTPVASRVNGRVISSYLNWAVGAGKTDKKANILADYDQEWFDQFAVEAFLYFNERDLRLLENSCANFQDAIVFRLMFEGVMGRECAELRNLKVSDVDGNILTLTDKDGSQRKLGVTDRCVSLIERAIRQEEYVKNNGDVDNLPANVKPTLPLANTGYVLRNALTRRESEFGAVTKDTLYRRIDSVREWFGGEYIINAKNVQKSGMIWYANMLMTEYKDFDVVLKKVAQKYKFKNTWSIKSWVNPTVIRDLYYKEDAK